MANAYVMEITKDNYDEKVVKAAQPVLLDFWASWCGPCRMVAPFIDQVAQEVDGKALVGKVNVDEQAELAKQFGVMSIPTLVVLKDGKVVDKQVGARDAAGIKALLEPHM